MKTSMDGWLNGFLGMAIFSGSLPATRVAVSGFEPFFLTGARAAIAALLAGAFLFMLRQARPRREDLVPLLIVSLGVVVAFPLLSALALRHVTAAHSLVFIGLLPLATATFGVLRGGERPGFPFWIFSGLGSLTVALFALSGGGEASLAGDLYMLGAVVLCGLGYAEGAVLSRRLGGWQVISWALVFSFPLMAGLAVVMRPSGLDGVPAQAWVGLGYVSVFSMLVGFVFWYRGLAAGGIASIGQLQLIQPFLGLAFAALLLGERIAWSMVAAAAAVVICVAFARRYA